MSTERSTYSIDARIAITKFFNEFAKDQFKLFTKELTDQERRLKKSELTERYKAFICAQASSFVDDFLRPSDSNQLNLVDWFTETLSTENYQMTHSNNHTSIYCNVLNEDERSFFSETILKKLAEALPDINDNDPTLAHNQIIYATVLVDILLNRAQKALNPANPEIRTNIEAILTLVIIKQAAILNQIKAELESAEIITSLYVVNSLCKIFVNQALSCKNTITKIARFDHPRIVDNISFEPLAQCIQQVLPALVRLTIQRQIEADPVANKEWQAQAIAELNSANTHIQLLQVIEKYIKLMTPSVRDTAKFHKALPASDQLKQQLIIAKNQLLTAQDNQLLQLDSHIIRCLDVELYPENAEVEDIAQPSTSSTNHRAATVSGVDDQWSSTGATFSPSEARFFIASTSLRGETASQPPKTETLELRPW